MKDRLRRAFLLVDSLHGLKRSDEEILSLFRHNAISHQIILSKVDRILFPKSNPSVACMERNAPGLARICEEMKIKIQPGKGDGPEALGEITACSAEATLGGKKLGINEVRWAILVATGFGEERRKFCSQKRAVDNHNIFPNHSNEHIRHATAVLDP